MRLLTLPHWELGGRNYNSASETSILPTGPPPRTQLDAMVFMLARATKRAKTVGGYNTLSVSHGHASHLTMVNGNGEYQNQTCSNLPL
jgi:stress response protein SCP2